MNRIFEEIKGKKVLILGFGLEGKTTYKFIRKYDKTMNIAIADSRENVILDELLKRDSNVTFHLGGDYLESIFEYECIIKSPGVSLKNIDITGLKGEITSQANLFMKYYKNQVVGITGTKGKTTTATLLNKVLQEAGRDSILVGNVGVAMFDILSRVKEDTIMVYELSSHQLQYMTNSPHIAIFLNVYQDHLDHYVSFEEYYHCKFNIANYQTEEDYLIYNQDNEIVREFAMGLKSKTIKMVVSQEQPEDADIYTKGEYIYHKNEKIYSLEDKHDLIGDHNNYNLMTVLGAAIRLGLTGEDVKRGVKSYKLYPHRLEYVGEFDKVKYYSDSIATIPEATIAAAKALDNVDTLIIGGYDRGIDYNSLIDFINDSGIDNIICMYDTGKRIYKYLDNNKRNIVMVDDLINAVRVAKETTKKVCLFSPAAASYGAFKNFEHRGDIYKQLVRM